MKVNNLRVFDNTLEGQMLLNYLKVQGLSLKSDKEENREQEEKKLLEETLCLKQLVESLLSEDNEVDLSYFIIGFNIPQINNEFDLLRFGRNFDLNIEDDVFIVCDIKKITKLIDNILSNAIKYNKIAGFIKVNLDDNILSIEDSGKGIEKENLKNLFERYSRFDKSVGGFGIGLNIVSLIAKEYGLKIDIKSQINMGTMVEITW